MVKNIIEMNGEELAEWLHDTYERLAKQVGWKTQDGTSVKFKDLPEKNKSVMLRLAQGIQLDLAGSMAGYRRKDGTQ